MNAHGKTFVVAAPFDNESLLLVNYLKLQNCKNRESFPP